MTLSLSRWLDAMHDSDTARAEAIVEFDALVSGSDDVSVLWAELPWQLAVHPIAITAHRAGRTDVLERLAERGIDILPDDIDREGDWIDTLPIERLRLVTLVRHPWAQRASVWTDPSPLLLGYVTDSRALDPFDINWTDPSQVRIELVLIASEALVDSNAPYGDWILTKSYYRPEDVTRNEDLSLSVVIDEDTGNPRHPVAMTLQSHKAGLLGPETRSDVHRLFRENGSYIEKSKPMSRVYDREGMIAAGAARRGHVIRALTGEIGVAATALGLDRDLVMASVLPAISALQDGARAEPAIAALAAWPALQNIANTRLAPWKAPVIP